jgi:hypothetical protein
MPVVRTDFVQSELAETPEYLEVLRISDLLLDHLNQPIAQTLITAANIPGASSSHVQNSFLPFATELGFHSEKKGLFAGGLNPGLRPDYFLEVGSSGILLEVERGKTTINNMDMLDLWKCHVCRQAHYLFLMVPQNLVQNEAGKNSSKPYGTVVKHMSSFFDDGNYTNVRGLHVFGY